MSQPELPGLIAGRLVDWFRRHGRDLPWRRTRDSYAIWVSEVMLQQTQVATVLPYYERWMTRFPTLRSLAGASPADVLSHWAGLGYYSRARSLHHAAQLILRERGGELPRTAAELRSLPGIGEYTAGAIASLANDQPVPAIDGNVQRVLSRLFLIDGDPKRGEAGRRIRDLAGKLVTLQLPSEINQAVMELGAMLCRPVSPQCSRCPVREFCGAHAEGLTAVLPAVGRRADPVVLRMAAAVIRHGEQFLLERLPADARWYAGMLVFPFATQDPDEPPEPAAARAARAVAGAEFKPVRQLEPLSHTVTRYRVRLTPVEGVLTGTLQPTADRLVIPFSPDELRNCDLGLPAPHRLLAARLLDSPQRTYLRVALALVWREGRLLITRRPSGVHLSGLWEFPGGKLDRSESAEEGAVREVLEETGLSCRAVRLREGFHHNYGDRHVVLFPVDCVTLQETPSLPDLEWRWCEPDRLDPAEFPPANAALIGELAAAGPPPEVAAATGR